MKLRKFIVFVLIFLNILIIHQNIYADDVDIEESDVSWIYETLEDVGSGESDEPIINSRAAVVYDRISGEIIWGKEENTQRKMASTTKIMTAIVIIENVENMGEVVVVSNKAASIGGSTLRFAYRR